MQYIRFFKELSVNDTPLVGGKNASLGHLISHMADLGIQVPDGFAITAPAYWHVLEYNNLIPGIKKHLKAIQSSLGDQKTLHERAAAIRTLITAAMIPQDLKKEIRNAYAILSEQYGQKNGDVALRSSATAEDLPHASFAGQQETYLHIKGIQQVFKAFTKCLASLFTDRALVYRQEKGFDHMKVALSVGVQKMVRSDKGTAGVAFSLDTETGFRDVVMINATYGLGEALVKGLVTPDEYMVHKPTFNKGFSSLIKKQLGNKSSALAYASGGNRTQIVRVSKKKQTQWALEDQEIMALTKMIITIENDYKQPIDVEWAKDGIDGQLYIVQVRPETVHAQTKKPMVLTQYYIQSIEQEPLLKGLSIGQHITSGNVKIIRDVSHIHRVQAGDIVVTSMTDPDWVPIMKKAAGIITERGGRTCHAAIVSRELGITAIIGVPDAMRVLRDDQQVTLDCSQGTIGYIYDGIIAYEKKEISLTTLPASPVPLLINCGDSSQALRISTLPVSGVGLARIEFIITNAINIHPMALLYPDMVTKKKVRTHIMHHIQPYTDGKTFFIDTLAQHVGMIAAAFYPKPVIVRLSDFKTNEYRQLIGGSYFEQEEENPMLGFRGAVRYYHESYKDAFALECAALKKVREAMGFVNVKVMVPFVRTVQEAERVIACLAENGLKRGDNGLEIIMMCELPANVVLIEQFAHYFDGFSIGSNDLAQLTLGIDRDSALVSGLCDERDEAVKRMLAMAIQGAHAAQKPIGICGQAPSDYPEIAQFLIEQQIDSISLNADSVIPFLMSLPT